MIGIDEEEQPDDTVDASTDFQDEYDLAAERHQKEREAEKAKSAKPQKEQAAPKQDKNRSALGKLWDALPSPGDAVRSIGRGIVKGGIEMAASAAEAGQMVYGQGTTGLTDRLNKLAGDDTPMIDKYHARAEEVVDKVVPASKNTVAGFVEGITQWVTGFAFAGKAFPIAKEASTAVSIAKGAAAGALTDATAIDPNQERLSNLVQSGPSWMRNSVTEFLASDPNDSKAVGRLKGAMEGLLTGAVVDGMIAGVKALRGVKGAVETVAEETAKEPLAVAARSDGTFTIVNLRDDGIALGNHFAPAREMDDEALQETFLKQLGRPLRKGETVSRAVDPTTGEPAFLLHSDGADWETLRTVSQLRGEDTPIDIIELAKQRDPAFKAKAEAEIEATGALGDETAEQAAIEKTARDIIGETADGETPTFATRAEAEATASSMNAAHANNMQPRASLTEDQLKGVMDIAEALKNGADTETIRRMVRGTDFNFNYTSSPAEVKAVIEAISIHLPDAVTKQRNRLLSMLGQTHDETDALAREIIEGFGGDGNKAVALIRQAFDNTERLPQIVRAVDIFMHGLGSKIARLGRAADAMPTNDVAHAELLQAVEHLWEIHADLAGTVSSTARTLESRKMINEGMEIVDHAAEKTAKDAEQALEDLRVARKQAEKDGVTSADPESVSDDLRAPKDYSSNARASEFNLAKARRRAQAIIKKIENAAKEVDDSPEAKQKAADKAAERNKQLLNDASIEREGPLPKDLEAPKEKRNPVEALGELLDREDKQLQKIIDDAKKKARKAPKSDAEKAAAKAARDANDPVGTYIRENKMPKMSRAQLRDFARQIHLAEGDPSQIMAAMHSTKKALTEPLTPSLWQRITSYRMEAMLSGPKTLIVNELSNAITSFQMPTEYWWAGVRTGNKQLREQGWDMLVGNVMEMKEAWSMGAKAFRTETNMLDTAASLIGDGGDRFVGEGATPITRGLLALGHLPSRLLLSRDEFWKTIAYRSNLRAQSLRLAREEGLEGAALAERVAADMKAGTSLDGAATNPVALQYARTATFQNPLGAGTTGGDIQKFVIDHPWARLFAPFVRTPINLFRYSWERTPGLNRFTQAWKADIKAGGERAAVAQAKTEMGMLLWGTAIGLAATKQITGGGPTDPDLRKQWIAAGHQPYSLHIPGVGWTSFRRSDPTFTALGIVADAFQMSSDMHEEGFVELAEAFTAGIASNLTSKTFMQGITEFMDAVSSREPHKMRRLFETTAGSFIPNIARQMDWNETLSETRSITDEMMARVPGFSEMLEPRRNIFGEKVLRPPGYFNRTVNPFVTVGEVDDNEALEQLLQLGKAFATPQEKHGDINLTDRDTWSDGKTDQSPYDYMMEYLSKTNGKQKNLRTDLTERMKQDSWKTASDAKRWIIAADVISGHQERAFDAMLDKYPKVKEAMKALDRKNADAIRRKRDVIKEAESTFRSEK